MRNTSGLCPLVMLSCQEWVLFAPAEINTEYVTRETALRVPLFRYVDVQIYILS